jgi:hypothetical protein
MLSLEAQQRIRETLRRLDQSLANAASVENELVKQAQGFRDTFFGAFQFIENESMALQEIQVQAKREGKQQLQVTSRGRPSFMLIMDSELAYDSKPPPAGQGQAEEGASQSTIELGARIFAVLTPPYQGLIRYYTIFVDGSWKRTTFALTANGARPRSALVPRATPDVLTLEAIDLLGYACMVHPTWNSMANEAEMFTLEGIQDRKQTKTHLSGLGMPRRENK